MAKSLVMRSAVAALAMITALGTGVANAAPLMGSVAPVIAAGDTVKSENLIEVQRRIYRGGRGFQGGSVYRGGRGFQGGRYAAGGRYGYRGGRYGYRGGRYAYRGGRYGYRGRYGYGRRYYPGVALGVAAGAAAYNNYNCDPYYDRYCGNYRRGYYGRGY